jgi:hypothetical protein
MTEPFDEYGDRLRRVLHTEAEAVTPSPEGLEQIRTKIINRRERRFGLWYALPWLRPLAAVGAAVCLSAVAVSATPALKNFVQTGHFSPEDQSGNRQTIPGSGRSNDQTVPGDSSQPSLSISPRPSTHPSTPGEHVVTGSCPAGEGTVTPPGDTGPGDQSVTPPPRPRVTCQPSQQTSTPPTAGPTTPPYTSPAATPTSEQPTSAAQPSVQASP